LILDSGAVLALSQPGRRARARAELQAAWEASVTIVIPAVVLAEVVRGDGPRDAPVNRIVREVDLVTPTTEQHGRLAGSLLARTVSNQTVDALVVAEAIVGGPARIATVDPDLRMLAEGRSGVEIVNVS
jgi:predicted nucleic acid-binding protein